MFSLRINAEYHAHQMFAVVLTMWTDVLPICLNADVFLVTVPTETQSELSCHSH